MNPFTDAQLKGAGIHGYGVIAPSEIVFSQEFRDICASNACGNYGKRWTCPPGVGTVEECKEKCLSYAHALVFQAVYPLEDSFDFEGMMEGHRAFKTACDHLHDLAKPVLDNFWLLANEGCEGCKQCTYPDAPCRFPDRMYPAVEGLGIYVSKLAESAGLKYINGANTVTYFGMLLY